MTPEEYQRLKDAEKEHLRKLKELKQAVRVLERQKKIRSELEKMSRDSEDVLQAQTDAVERLAFETAMQEARMDLALEGDEPPPARADEALEQELRTARAHSLVERMKQSMAEGDDFDITDAPTDEQEASRRRRRGDADQRVADLKPREPTGGQADVRGDDSDENVSRQESGSDRSESSVPPASQDRPEKTIGRM